MGEHYHQLTEEERIEIYAQRKAKKSAKNIAVKIKRSPSTIYREIKRNSGQRGYRPKQAHEKASNRKKIPRTIKMTKEVIRFIINALKKEWSPEQISAKMKENLGVKISIEWIYQFIYERQKHGDDLYKYLRIAGKKRKRKRCKATDGRGKIRNRRSIDERPAVIEERLRIGDWEVDLVSGAHHKGFLVTLVERKSRFVVVGHVKQKKSSLVRAEIIRIMSQYKSKILTLTFDNGLEFCEHEEVASALNCDSYFAHPYCSWERGTNENTNGLLRQYFPKHTNLRDIDLSQIIFAQNRLNSRPRKILGFKTPGSIFWGN